MSRRFWVSLLFSIPLVLLSMAEMVPGMVPAGMQSGRGLVWLQFLLAAPVVLWGGLPFFERGWQSIVNRSLNMFTLIALGTGTAFVYQRGRRGRPRHLSRLVPSSRRGRGLLRAGRGDRHAGLAGPGARAASPPPDRQCHSRACSGWPPRRLAGSARMDAKRTCRSIRSFRAIGCGSGPARRFPSTAW